VLPCPSRSLIPKNSRRRCIQEEPSNEALKRAQERTSKKIRDLKELLKRMGEGFQELIRQHRELIMILKRMG